MASPLLSPVVVLVICAVAADVDAHECSPEWATCTKGRTWRTSLWSDLKNYGKCGSKCACGPHATSKCIKGKCSFECDKKNGWCDCDGDHHNGCEVNTQWDKKNCGRCRRVCPAPPNFVASCVKGVCEKECKSGYKQCGNSCVKVAADVNNCGGCGIVCSGVANGTASCVGGTCDVVCKPGFSTCDGNCLSTMDDIQNCGGCGTVCPGGSNGMAVCASGTCDLVCNPRFMNCDGDCYRTGFSDLHCGRCGSACSVETEFCNIGRCFSRCLPNLRSCEGLSVDISNDLFNCGRCGNNCSVSVPVDPVCYCGECLQLMDYGMFP